MLAHALIVGHRGNSAIAPENTLVSLVQAFDAGADLVEADIRLSGDGVPVLMHDASVDRTTDGTGDVEARTLAQLKELDAGSWKSSGYGGERVPTLAEALEQARGRGQLYLDLKVPGMGAAIAAVLDDLGLPDSAVWAAADSEALVRDFHEHVPGAKVLWWGSIPARAKPSYFDSMRAIGVAGFDLKWSEFPGSFVRDAQTNGMFFSTYTLERVYDVRRAMRMGLDAIETNDPAQLAAWIDGAADSVTVQLRGDELLVVGDKYENRLRIESGPEPGDVRIVGLRGTKIGGEPERTFRDVRNLEMSLGAGDDYSAIVDLWLEGGLSVDAGSGNDTMDFTGTGVNGSVKLYGSSGSDSFRIFDSFLGTPLLDGGSGADWTVWGESGGTRALERDALLVKMERVSSMNFSWG